MKLVPPSAGDGVQAETRAEDGTGDPAVAVPITARERDGGEAAGKVGGMQERPKLP